jgi:hypothetical protein
MPTGDQSGDGWHPAQPASYQSDCGDAGGSALTRGPAHARVGRVIAPSAPSLTHSSSLRAERAARSARAVPERTRTREAARPHAHAPARPRSRVVRARTWVRAPPRVLPDAVLKPSARSPRSSATKCGLEFLPTVFFSSGDRRLVTVTVSGCQ